MNMENLYNKRVLSFEIIRCVAVICVLCAHAVVYIISVKQINFSFEPYFEIMIWEAILGWGHYSVPMFLYISGYFLLSREDSIKKTYKKMFKLIFVLLIWSIIYIYIKNNLILFDYDLSDSAKKIKDIFHNPAMHHLWYMYLYIYILLFVPILQQIISRIDRKYVFLMLAVWFLFEATIPFFANIKNVHYNIYSAVDLKMTGYFILGSYIPYFASKVSKKQAVIFIGLMLLYESYGAAGCYLENLLKGIYWTDYTYTGFIKPTNIIGSYLVCILLYKINWENLLSKKYIIGINSVSSNSFIMYLVHMIPMTILLNGKFIPLSFWQNRPTLMIIETVIITFITSYIMAVVLNKLMCCIKNISIRI